MKLFRGLAVSGAALAFAIAVLGSWVRINNAGLTCPDWPLCNGALVPALHGGVVLEWTHRLVAFLEGLVVLGAIAAGWRVRGRIAGVGRTLAALAAMFVLQVLLGAATVQLANSPLSVMLHWGVGMAFLAALCVLAVLGIVAPPRGGPASQGDTAAATLLGAAAGLAFVAMCAGAYVSSSYAGLACTTFPSCDGTLFGTGAAQFVQMLHRVAAGAFVLAAVVGTFAVWEHASPRVRLFACAGLTLAALQVVLGAANVFFNLPIALREAHAANAPAVFLAFAIAAVLAALDPARRIAAAKLPLHARGTAPAP